MALDTEYHNELFATKEDGTFVYESEIANQIRDIRAIMAEFDPACAPSNELQEVRMTADEYHGLLDRLNKAELELKAAKADAENVEAIKKAEMEISAAQEITRESEEEAASLRKQIEEAEATIENEKKLHENLIRIMRERADQTREIRPKKQHDGYIVLESRQRIQQYKEEVWDTDEHKNSLNNEECRSAAQAAGYLRIVRKTASVWKSIIQTPYDATIPIGLVQGRIEKEMEPVLQELGIDSRPDPENNGKYYDFGTNEDGKKKNVMYRWSYNANCRARLWEIEIYTTGELRLTGDRLPPQKMNTKF